MHTDRIMVAKVLGKKMVVTVTCEVPQLERFSLEKLYDIGEKSKSTKRWKDLFSSLAN